MLEWIIGALLGFLGEFLRGLYQDRVANSALREAGELKAQNDALKEQLKVKDQAQTIKEKTDAQDDFGALIDGL
ncbi:hypothetical protein [Cohaesibacter celericrescens]|uniref:Uncharacterized protein n=1 Tax=Cohaesibacter celericrescens TaxID=2067669 RepID=A0A2N5XQS3_9HYPH|nr:hypothetical protein [Cohaesibacter celericrescens]PLW76790.1 hypothetical protein C0081_12060 [Cohaesibacter celericrescens]